MKLCSLSNKNYININVLTFWAKIVYFFLVHFHVYFFWINFVFSSLYFFLLLFITNLIQFLDYFNRITCAYRLKWTFYVILQPRKEEILIWGRPSWKSKMADKRASAQMLTSNSTFLMFQPFQKCGTFLISINSERNCF